VRQFSGRKRELDNKAGDCGKLAISLRNRFKYNRYGAFLAFARAFRPQNKQSRKIFRKAATRFSTCFVLSGPAWPAFKQNKAPPPIIAREMIRSRAG
jgi:hypothetical protein